jgi:hypothetical protein
MATSDDASVRMLNPSEQLVLGMCRRLDMYVVGPKELRQLFALLIGFESSGAGVFCGLREWLVVRLNGPNNRGWTGLAEDAISNSAPAADERARIAAIEALLTEFFTYRHEVGHVKIFYDYAKWLLRQPWYAGPLREQKKRRKATKRRGRT